MAFQIADDLLDLVGEETDDRQIAGHRPGAAETDAAADSSAHTRGERLATRVRQILSSPDNHKREALRPCLIESGGLEYARRRAEDLAAEARAELVCLPPSPCRSILEALTERVRSPQCVTRSHFAAHDL